MVTPASQIFISAVAQAYDQSLYPAQHIQMRDQAGTLNAEDQRNAAMIPNELTALMPPEITAMITGYIPTMDEWIQTSGIFSPEYSEQAVELASSEKLVSLYTNVKEKIEAIQAEHSQGRCDDRLLNQVAEDLSKRIKDGEKLNREIDFLHRKTKQQEITNLGSNSAGLLPVSNKFRLLNHIFFHAFMHSSNASKREIIDAADALRPLLNPHLSLLEKSWDFILNRSIDWKIISFASLILLISNTILISYVIHQLIFPYIISTLVPLLLNPAYCPLVIVKIGEVVVGSCVWLINHKAVQILLLGVPPGIRFLAKKLNIIKNQTVDRVEETVRKIILRLPINFIIGQSFFRPLAIGLRRSGVPVIEEILKIPSLPNERREYQKNGGQRAMLVWLDLMEHIGKMRRARIS